MELGATIVSCHRGVCGVRSDNCELHFKQQIKAVIKMKAVLCFKH